MALLGICFCGVSLRTLLERSERGRKGVGEKLEIAKPE
tara:strand:+ start:85634 stop:85747 length:114 start_codon:yes stop_codon:yes gene_type:complete